MSWSSSERAFESRFGTIGINDPSMRSREYDIIKEGIKRCPGDPSLYMIEAMYLRRENRKEEALEKLEALSKRTFGNRLNAGMFDPHVWHALGICKSDLFDFDGAVKAFECGSRARKDGILNLPCITAEAHAEFINGNVGRARQLFILGRDKCIDCKNKVPRDARTPRRQRRAPPRPAAHLLAAVQAGRGHLRQDARRAQRQGRRHEGRRRHRAAARHLLLLE